MRGIWKTSDFKKKHYAPGKRKMHCLQPASGDCIHGLPISIQGNDLMVQVLTAHRRTTVKGMKADGKVLLYIEMKCYAQDTRA